MTADPVELALADGSRVACDAVLRHLPGKREVYAGRRNGDAVVAKLYLDPRRAAVHAGREAKGLQAFAAAGVAAPDLLFHGVDAVGRPVVVVRHIPGAESLNTCWQQADPQARGELLRRMMQLLARHHAAGICQRDLHLNNFLVTADHIYSIDGDAVETGLRPLSRRRSLQNLALFCAQFLPAVDAVSLPATAAYAADRGWPGERLREKLPPLIAAARRRRWRKFRGKLYRECTDIARLRTAAGDCLAVRKHADALGPLLHDPDASCPDDRSQRLKDGNTATVWRTLVGDMPVVVKRYNIKGRRHGVRLLAKESRASISWRNAHLLQFHGIATPPPLACVSGRGGLLRRRNYVVNAALDGQGLDAWVRQHREAAQDIEAMARQVGQLFAQLKALRVAHGDTKATNLLVADGTPHLIDLDAMRGFRSRTAFARAWRRDMRRFLDNWRDDDELHQQMRLGLEAAGAL
jgi:tRNA A-37 threonylcarbamoyl transferase component Bud32